MWSFYFPFNAQVADQAVSRAHRYAQIRECYIWILTINYLYDQLLQSRAEGKMIVILVR